MRSWMMIVVSGCGVARGLDGQGEPLAVEPPDPELHVVVDDGPIEVVPAPGAHDWVADVDAAWVFDHTAEGVWCAFEPMASATANSIPK